MHPTSVHQSLLGQSQNNNKLARDRYLVPGTSSQESSALWVFFMGFLSSVIPVSILWLSNVLYGGVEAAISGKSDMWDGQESVIRHMLVGRETGIRRRSKWLQ